MRALGVLGAAAAVAMLAADASAAEVQLRGGWAGSIEGFPFTREYEDGPAVFGDYGQGGFGEADIHVGLFGPYGLELGTDFTLLENEDSFGHEPTGTSCFTETFLGLISDCHDLVAVKGQTRLITVDALATRDVMPGLRAAFGATALLLDSKLHADHIFPGGFEDFVNRDTSFDAFGVKGGVEHRFPLMNTGLSLNSELYGGWVWGERRVDIDDFRTINGAFLEEDAVVIRDDIDVPVVEAGLALSWKASSMVSFEVGGKYRRLFGAMFTVDTAQGSGVGSDSADFDQWTVFAGITLTP